MDALYSGFTYASNELRRAAKPVIDTLAPVLPTFGCGEAAVKQSVSSCIHEMEAGAITDFHVHQNGMGWSSGFSSVKRIVLYPLMDLASFFDPTYNCRDSTELEMGMMANVTRNINEQLASWGIPFRFELSDLYMSEADVLRKEANNCVSRGPNKDKMALAFAHCDSPMVDGELVGGYQERCLIVLKSGAPKATFAHELSHVFSPHTFEAIPLSSLHPDVTEAMCEAGAHGHELITSLSYWNHCRDAGFPDTETHLQNSRGQWGPIDLTMAKLATHKERDATHAQIHAEGVDQSYEWIRQNYGPRIAEQFVASFSKSVFVHTMSAIAVRSISDKRLLRLTRLLIHAFGNLLQLGMMSQISYQSPLPFLAYCMAGNGVFGRSARAIIDVMGDAALLRSFVQYMRGNSDAMLQLVYATCGTAAGDLFSQLIYGLIEICAPTDAEQRNTYVEMTRPTGTAGLITDELIHVLNELVPAPPAENTEEKLMSRLPGIVRTIITIDKAVAGVIRDYVSLHVMTSWLWKADQQKADAQVQASVDKLSATLDGVKSKFGPTDLPRVPSNTRSFRPTEPVPPLDLDRAIGDDPLPSTDVAAVTGIGSAARAEEQQALYEKKKQ